MELKVKQIISGYPSIKIWEFENSLGKVMEFSDLKFVDKIPWGIYDVGIWAMINVDTI